MVRLKFKLDKILSLSIDLTNEFVTDYLDKLIHLILSKHKCSPISNELSLILIRNFFKQFQLADADYTPNENNQNLNLYEVLKKKLNLHLNEAHSCDSIMSLNKLTNIRLDQKDLSSSLNKVISFLSHEQFIK